MTPRPPNWIRKSSTPWPKGLSTELMSTGVSPVTQTAEVARKQASRVCSSRPGCQLGGRQSSTVPRAMAPRKEKTGQVRGLNKRLHRIGVVYSRRGGIARRAVRAKAGSALRPRRVRACKPLRIPARADLWETEKVCPGGRTGMSRHIFSPGARRPCLTPRQGLK